VAFLEHNYPVPYKFTGKINKLTFNLGPKQLPVAEGERRREKVARAPVPAR
jgi:hypothetical protein